MDRNRNRQSAKRSSSWCCSCRFRESGSGRDITEKKTHRQVNGVQRIVRYLLTCARRIVRFIIFWSYTKSIPLGFKCLFFSHKSDCFGSAIKAPTVLKGWRQKRVRFSSTWETIYFLFSFLFCNVQMFDMYSYIQTNDVCYFNKIRKLILRVELFF